MKQPQLFPRNLNLVKLPAKEELTIFLIAEDIRNRKIMKSLEKEGFDTADAGDLSKLVLGLVGIENRTDGLYTFYFNQLDEHAVEFDLSENTELHEKAFYIYKELLIWRFTG
ncbi:hypothetical protein MYP_5004 [Sporocytophaga myxococcoides]|uniref:Uncharacterized protein n=1 Tax=Sporocytophaga myxococcoides TaxID=153721 RepID=A0A098LP19_9BACT|nr:hypothetical protein [Sporocytophaga myxococcoides]GAL87773.1 hypothetical protein MYP_5004 [Sporocytophaga myxococcoides]